MSILSYVVRPQTGAMGQLCAELSVMEYCAIVPSDNYEVVVLLTNTPDEKTENELQETLKQLPSLQSLRMTLGHKRESKEEKMNPNRGSLLRSLLQRGCWQLVH